jgi:isoquinoline 1-oxidoreductase beta subunit
MALAAAAGGAAYLARPARTGLIGRPINDFVAITEDGTIEVICPAAELGQGSSTVLPMILAEEIGADLLRVRVRSAPRDAARFGNPEFDGRMVTADSKTTYGYFDVLRRAGAEARIALIGAAAAFENWSPADCRTKGHAVVHIPSGRTIDFRTIGENGRLRTPRAVGPADFKPRSDYVVLGTSPAPAGLQAKVTGAFAFGIDRRSPEASVAVVVRSPHLGGQPIATDDIACRAVDGVEDVVVLDDGVAVVARHTFAALKGSRLLAVQWTKPTAFDDAAQERALTAALSGSAADVVTVSKSGRPDQEGHAIEVDVTLASPQVSHLAQEPLNAEARGTTFGLAVAVAGSTQSPDLDMRYAARTWKTAPFMVETEAAPSGGAFGRRVLNDVVRDAAAVAKAVGRPVQVIRPLVEELRRGQVRPAAVQRIVARADAAGRLLTWRHSVASDSVLARHLTPTFEARGRIDNTATDGLRHPYAVSVGEEIRWCRHSSPPDPGFLRGVSAGYTVFAIETVADRIARAAGRDPLEWRLAHLTDPRGRRVVEAAAAKGGWLAEDGLLRGIATMTFRRSWIATVATLSNVGGNFRIERLDIVADVGLAIHPDLVVRQIEGATVFGLSMATLERLPYEEGQAAVASVADYPILTTDAIPPIAVELVAAGDADDPGGAGELGVPTVAPAVANAASVATGSWPGRLPFDLGAAQRR